MVHLTVFITPFGLVEENGFHLEHLAEALSMRKKRRRKENEHLKNKSHTKKFFKYVKWLISERSIIFTQIMKQSSRNCSRRGGIKHSNLLVLVYPARLLTSMMIFQEFVIMSVFPCGWEGAENEYKSNFYTTCSWPNSKTVKLKTVFIEYPGHILPKHLVCIISLPTFLMKLYRIILQCIFKAFPKTEAKSLSKSLDW